MSLKSFIFLLFVKIAPPPPVVIVLFPLKLKQPTSEKVPKCLFLYASIASDASSK